MNDINILIEISFTLIFITLIQIVFLTIFYIIYVYKFDTDKLFKIFISIILTLAIIILSLIQKQLIKELIPLI